MLIMITGGSGFIGSNLAKSLLEDNHKVICVDNFSTGKRENIKDITTFTADLSDENEMQNIDILLKDIDIVYHFASSVGVKLVYDDPVGALKNITKINNNLFPLFEKHQVKVIFASTSEVYGETKNKFGSKETDHLEIHPVQKPRGKYAVSKLFSEFMLGTYTFPYVIARFFNIIGPEQLPDFGHVIPKFIERSNLNVPLYVYGNGSQVRSFCDIRDTVEMLKILINDEHNGEIYNIGNSDNSISMINLAKLVNNITSSNSQIYLTPFDKIYGVEFEDIFNRFPCTDKINKYYTCKYTLEDTIRKIYETNSRNRTSS